MVPRGSREGQRRRLWGRHRHSKTPDSGAREVVEELGWTGPWFLVSALGREGTWPIMLEVMAFLDRLRAEEAEERDADAAR